MRLTTNINGINGVGPGQIATVLFPTDRRYHEILLRVGTTANPVPTWAQMHAAIKIIKLKANAATIREFTVAELELILASKGQPMVAGYLPIFFSEPWRVTRFEEEIFALVTSGMNTFSLEVEFNDVAGVSLSGTITYDFSNDKNKAFMRWERHTVPISAVGDFDWNSISRIGAISTIHLVGSTVDRVRVTADNQEVMDRTAAQNARLIDAHGYSTSGEFAAMFDYTGYADDALTLTKSQGSAIVPRDEFNVKITTNAATAIPAIIERIQYV